MRSFDLITCMHGLHYLGDKSALPARTASWLTATGRLIADVDLASIRLADGRPAGRRLTTRLRTAGCGTRLTAPSSTRHARWALRDVDMNRGDCRGPGPAADTQAPYERPLQP